MRRKERQRSNRCRRRERKQNFLVLRSKPVPDNRYSVRSARSFDSLLWKFSPRLPVSGDQPRSFAYANRISVFLVTSSHNQRELCPQHVGTLVRWYVSKLVREADSRSCIRDAVRLSFVCSFILSENIEHVAFSARFSLSCQPSEQVELPSEQLLQLVRDFCRETNREHQLLIKWSTCKLKRCKNFWLPLANSIIRSRELIEQNYLSPRVLCDFSNKICFAGTVCSFHERPGKYFLK